MNLAEAQVTPLEQDYHGTTAAALLARYQDRLWRHVAHADARTQNIIMRCMTPQLLELRNGSDAVGPLLIVDSGRRRTGAPIHWRLTCKRYAKPKSGRLWYLDATEVDDIRALLEAIAKHANPASA